MSLSDLEAAGFDIQTVNHARAVLTKDFPEPLAELCDVLMAMHITDVELIRGGGGEAGPTQRLRRALTERGWRKRKIVISKTVDGTERSAISHEIDHVRQSEPGSIALEIEWNNKDPFFDRDLENFQRLHSEGAISVGTIVTRGQSLNDSLHDIVLSCATAHDLSNFDDLALFEIEPTRRQRELVRKGGADFPTSWARAFVRDKFGSATTHWAKLQERIKRGVGNPCPLLLIGLPDGCVEREILDAGEER